MKNLKFIYIQIVLFLFIIFTIIITAVWWKGKKYSDYILESQTYVKDSIMQDITIPYNERAMIVSAWYSKVIYKFMSEKKSKSMNQWQVADFVRLMFRWTEQLGLPKNYLLSKGTMESCWNPNLDGPCGEKGIYQHHRTVLPFIQVAWIELNKVDQKLAEELNPRIRTHEDLYNPITSLKAQCLIAWYCKKEFHGNIIWWVSASHWGDFRMARYFDTNQEPPMRFTFYKNGKIVADRNPLKYFFHWQSINDKFDRGELNVFRELDTYKNYKSKRAKEDIQFENAIKTINRLSASVAKLEYKIDQVEKYKDDVKSLIDTTDKKYKAIYGEDIERKKDYYSAYRKVKTVFKQLVKDLKTQEKANK